MTQAGEGGGGGQPRHRDVETGRSPVNAADEARSLADPLIVAEAGDVARGWHFLTVDNLAPHGKADALLYERALDTFDEAAGDRECRHRGRPNSLTFGIRSKDAQRRIAWLHTRLEKLKPPDLPGYGSWDIREGVR